ncbi:hypothetical protein Slin14017_G051200 [Septoria linicola]|nr:hypothetical protein Slin14017_G051200 [Septoria linicola]
MYDHRIGIGALALLALPFALTFMLIALIGLASLCLLLGHVGAFLSSVLKIILPIPILTNYLEALSSPYSLLVATFLVSGIAAAWIYLAVRYNDFLFDFKIKFPQLATSTKKLVAIEETENLSDDRTVIHQAAVSPEDKPELSDSNPFIRRVLRNTDYDSISQMHEPTPQARLRPTASTFEFSPQPRSEPRLRPTAKDFQFTPERQRLPSGISRAGPRNWDWPAHGGGFIVREMSGSLDGVQEGDRLKDSQWAH